MIPERDIRKPLPRGMCSRSRFSSVDRVIEATNLTKVFGGTPAVSGVTFRVGPGTVTGFLGPNGSGKSTTMRMMLDLDRPSAGAVRVGGRHYRELRHPLRTVGALLDAGAVHGGRTARAHLVMLAHSNAIRARRVDEVLELVGLTSVARRRVGGFSLGMRQRLGIAAALLGDPEILILDEPMNGLDTEGIRWLRTLLHEMAAQGRTVLVAGHVMSEMQSSADRLLVIGAGRILADEPMADFLARHSPHTVRVRSLADDRLTAALIVDGATVERDGDGLLVHGLPVATIGARAVELGIVVTELATVRATLEDVYTEMVAPHGQYRHGEVA